MWTVHGSLDPINSRNQPNVAGLKDSVHLEKKLLERETSLSRKETLVQRKKKFHVKVGREEDDTDLKEYMSIC